MGTVTNGEKWAGACVNGKVVSGLVKNGVVFYRKPVSTYKRRIMVGDNLSYKTIYCDFPENYYQIISEEMGMGNQRRVIISDVQTTYIVENNLSPNFEVRVINGVQWQNNIYNYQNGNLITNLTSLSLENFGNVMTVNDNQAYRHIYVADTNIRPIQVGDKIVAGTKIYFNYPDNYYEQWPADGTYNEVIQVGLLGAFYHSRDSSGAMSIRLDFFDSFFGLSEYIYETDDNGNVSTNKSYVEFTQDEGEVTYVDTNYSHDAATKYILVDETTLGA